MAKQGRTFYLFLLATSFIFTACQNEENNMMDNSNIHSNNNGINNEQESDETSNNNEANTEVDENKKEKQMSDMSTKDWKVETLAENLEIPWSLNIHEDVIYMTDRDGHILEVDKGQVTRTELKTSLPIEHTGEGGLLGFALAEDFAETKIGYAYYTFMGENKVLKNRVVQVEKQANSKWMETNILLDDIPGATIHNGGRLAIGPDSMLYVTTGDADRPDDAQEKNNLSGSILRMTTTGEIPANNPFDSYVFSYGHRNPQGLAWNKDDELYSSEHGQSAHDEINLIQAGSNYGWPVIEGEQTNNDMKSPLIHSSDDTWAPSGITFWDNHLLVTGLRGESLYYFDEDKDEMIEVFQGEGRLRDVKYYNQAIYLITNNTDGRGTPQENDDRLLKLSIQK